jgi:hypothetical protein
MDGIDGVLIHFALRMTYPKSLCGFPELLQTCASRPISVSSPASGAGMKNYACPAKPGSIRFV